MATQNDGQTIPVDGRARSPATDRLQDESVSKDVKSRSSSQGTQKAGSRRRTPEVTDAEESESERSTAEKPRGFLGSFFQSQSAPRKEDVMNSRPQSRAGRATETTPNFIGASSQSAQGTTPVTEPKKTDETHHGTRDDNTRSSESGSKETGAVDVDAKSAQGSIQTPSVAKPKQATETHSDTKDARPKKSGAKAKGTADVDATTKPGQASAETKKSTKPQGRTIVMCFDGTGNKFGKNSNVVRFFHALKKDDPEKQIAYYQPGIGTYAKQRFFTKTASHLASKANEAIAYDLHDHVQEGYIFLMQNYRKGDKLCMFGFSRGAYTARALCGMIYKIGLLPPHNDQQVDFGFSVYNDSSAEGARLGHKFKSIFATSIKINFLGVWDTVSSVGIFPRSLPHSTYNDGVVYFRHALALDEQRARFRPNIWGEPLAVKEELEDDPEIEDSGDSRDLWVYNPPKLTDVKEVWFAGCHADVGGGSHEDDELNSLSNIPLRWMIKECFRCKTGILFNDTLLDEYGITVNPTEGSKPAEAVDNDAAAVAQLVDLEPKTPAAAPGLFDEQHALDAVAAIYNQLQIRSIWWLLEFIPMISTYQTPTGSWFRIRLRNFGHGRYLPYLDGEVKVHESVRQRIEQTKNTPKPYKPEAYNWKDIVDLKMVTYVD